MAKIQAQDSEKKNKHQTITTAKKKKREIKKRCKHAVKCAGRKEERKSDVITDRSLFRLDCLTTSRIWASNSQTPTAGGAANVCAWLCHAVWG